MISNIIFYMVFWSFFAFAQFTLAYSINRTTFYEISIYTDFKLSF